MVARNPMRWPGEWNDPSYLRLLKGTAINCLLIESQNNLESVAAKAWQDGLEVVRSASLPSDVTVVTGEWPGVKLTQSGELDLASAGPTGAPWVDSNGWRVRLAATLHPGNDIWVDANPTAPRLFPESYVLGVVDAAAYGGRWIITLDKRLAEDIAAQKQKALDTWKKLTAAAGFFPAHKAWPDFPPEAVLGIISDFSGENEFFSNELLNLVARGNQQYRILLRGQVSQASFAGLRAVLYSDTQAPSPDLQKQILAFVEEGGMLISGPNWGELAGGPSIGDGYPSYSQRTLGKGRLAIAKDDLADPFLVAHDATVLISHRYDLLRFWNGGALASHYTMAPGRKEAIVQVLFYASGLPRSDVSVRVAGHYRAAKLWTLDRPTAGNVDMEIQKDAVELHLPAISQYAAVELKA